jgi:hypothetical protein
MSFFKRLFGDGLPPQLSTSELHFLKYACEACDNAGRIQYTPASHKRLLDLGLIKVRRYDSDFSGPGKFAEITPFGRKVLRELMR